MITWPITNIIPSGNLISDGNCLAGNSVLDVVYVTGPDIGGFIQVASADSTDLAKMPAIGMIISKSSPTVCKILLWGSVIYGVLVPNARYYVGLSGGIVLYSALPVPRPLYVQAIGQAMDAARLALMPEKDMVKLT